jgi:hypothetical protein
MQSVTHKPATRPIEAAESLPSPGHVELLALQYFVATIFVFKILPAATWKKIV